MVFEELKENGCINPEMPREKFDSILKLLDKDEIVKVVFWRKKVVQFTAITNVRILKGCFEHDYKIFLVRKFHNEDMILEDVPLLDIKESTIKTNRDLITFSSVNGFEYEMYAPMDSPDFLKSLISERRNYAKKHNECLRTLRSISYIDGLPSYSGGYEVIVSLYPDKLVFKQEDNYYMLPIEKIKNLNLKTESEVLKSEKERSVLKRAVAGGILLGPLGAIVGGMSGIPSKKEGRIVSQDFFVLDYESKEGVEQTIMLSSAEHVKCHREIINDFIDYTLEQKYGDERPKENIVEL